MSVFAHPRIRAACVLLAASALLAVPATSPAKPKPDGRVAPGDRAAQGSISCSVLTPGVQPGVIHTVGHYTVTPSGNGSLICHGRVPERPRRTIVVNGLRCPTPAGITTRSHTVITRSGRVTLTCHFKG